ncbi:MAG: TRAP transporter small permease [Proteobacteria bacterium]|uniref:TRAP transporter small permease protein n=1 Tax=Candidatus Avisuccinivibrio stercorigallinarum TaxID=2840704 RepID=A0A9D9GTF2_9GAMM|nr:TRAP transporter small permease [Candidatus Avisuccinivibrio stercorigallinarum]
MDALRKMLDKVLLTFCVFLFMLMTVVGTYQICTRYFFNSPSTISEELITYSFTWLSILSAAIVFGERGHLCMAFVYNQFKGKKRVFLDMISEVLVIATAVLLLIYGGYVMAAENMNQLTASLGVNMGLMYAVLPISGVLITVYGVLNLVKMVQMLSDPNIDQYGVNTEEE